MPTAEFLSLNTVDILSWIILWCGDCPVHYKVYSSILDFYPLDASNVPLLIMTTQNVFNIAKCLREAKSSSNEYH